MNLSSDASVMRSLAVAFALSAAFAVAGAGCSSKDGEAGRCDAGVVRMCAWNGDTGAYDRDCRMTCANPACPAGGLPQMRCAWDEATQAYTRDCTFMACPPAGGRPACPVPAPTSYYANDPRCDPTPDAAAAGAD